MSPNHEALLFPSCPFIFISQEPVEEKQLTIKQTKKNPPHSLYISYLYYCFYLLFFLPPNSDHYSQCLQFALGPRRGERRAGERKRLGDWPGTGARRPPHAKGHSMWTTVGSMFWRQHENPCLWLKKRLQESDENNFLWLYSRQHIIHAVAGTK